MTGECVQVAAGVQRLATSGWLFDCLVNSRSDPAPRFYRQRDAAPPIGIGAPREVILARAPWRLASALQGRCSFHQPPPRARNSAAVSAKRFACACTWPSSAC
jgi:hypothetical protein